MAKPATKVAIVRCSSYEQGEVDLAVAEAVELSLGAGWKAAVREPVLVKPNVLSPHKPADGVCTHPAVLRAVLRLLQETGAKDISVGDSSGGSGTRSTATDKALEASGLADAARDMGARLRSFDHEKAVSVPNPRGPAHRTLVLAEPALEASRSGWLVSVPKLKTHALTLLTGAVKNLFGTVPGAAKRETHRQNPSPDSFADALVDIAIVLQPKLHVVDAVMAMEGEGPSGGPLVKLGLIVAGSDPVAVDAVLAAIAGVDPRKVPTIRLGGERGLGESSLARIEVVGVPVAEATGKRFRLPVVSSVARLAPPGLVRAAVSFMVTRPAFEADKCKLCAVCAQNCPAGALQVRKGLRVPELDDERCIACFCCSELCPERAVYIRWRNPVARVIFGTGRGARRGQPVGPATGGRAREPRKR